MTAENAASATIHGAIPTRMAIAETPNVNANRAT